MLFADGWDIAPHRPASDGKSYVFNLTMLTTTYKRAWEWNDYEVNMSKSEDGNNISWYCTDRGGGSVYQANKSKTTYFYLAIG